MRRNIANDWFKVYPIKTIIRDLERIGNYNEWDKNFIKLLKTDYTHPMTIVLLQKYSIKKVLKMVEKRAIKWSKLGRGDDTSTSSFVRWVNEYQYEYK